MAVVLSDEMIAKLETQQVLWISSVRANGRPHLAPIWFVWYAGRVYLATEPGSVKARNIRGNPSVSLALEDGEHPVICEGTARLIEKPWDEGMVAAFFKKYEWNLNTEQQYHQLIEVTPEKWLAW